ncbi:hypothetical protein, partial [Klebsiella pneumoniae]|uniref:hypothetical protein n=1 Tax=Klebsiella pneumoniae TaxID=573 RepID=UPI001F3E82DD
FRLAGDIAAAGEQRFRQLQLLTILSFKGIQRQNKADLLLLNGRQLPDKAVDLLDTASARLRMSLDTVPQPLTRMKAQLTALAM